MKERLKRFIFRLLGKDPESIVISFATGPQDLAARMYAEIQELVPGRRHFLVRPDDFTGFADLRRRFRPYRIGLAPVLFTADPQYQALRRAAFLLAPFRILAYNSRLDRHHLRLTTFIASWLFLRGVPLDRIFLRPIWLVPWKSDRSQFPTKHEEFAGRPFVDGRTRVAILSPYFPYPLSHGGAVRIFNLIREIARQFDVILISFTDQDRTQVAPLLEHCARIYLIEKPRYREPRWSTLLPPEVAEFQVPALRRLLDRLRSELKLDLVQVEYTALAPYAGDILVEHDVTFELYRQIHERERTLASAWNYWRWRRFEKRWIARYRRVLVMSEEDRRVLNRPNVAVVPNGVDLARFWPEHERPGQRLLFIGSFRHFPNIVAFRFFLDQVWPRLREESPEISLTVVAGPDPALYWREHTGLLEIPQDDRIQVFGFVADVRPLYIEANLVLVPTLVSAGTNLKVLEALAMDRAVLSTSSGCAGLGLRHGETVWVADGADAFAQGALTLLRDPELRRRIADAGRRHAELHFDWPRIGILERSLLRQLTSQPPRLRPATPADINQIWAIQTTAPEASQWHRDDYLGFDCMVSERDGQIVGFLVSREVGPGEREILNIAVHPEYRRLGIAANLIKDELRRHPGDHFLEVRESNAPARNLYTHLGFREVGVRPGYYENPLEPGIVMRFFS